MSRVVTEANGTTQQYLSLVGSQAVVGYNHNPPGPFQSTRRGMLLYPCRSCMCMICFLVPVSTHALQNNVCVTSPDPSPPYPSTSHPTSQAPPTVLHHPRGHTYILRSRHVSSRTRLYFLVSATFMDCEEYITQNIRYYLLTVATSE